MFGIKKKRKIFSGMEDVSKICATCKFAAPLHATGDFMCSKNGLVSRDYTCKSFEYNYLMKRPPKKRQIDVKRFTPEDFSID